MAIEITNAFIESKSHNLNLIDENLKEIGMMIVFEDKQEQGYLYYYFTQDFGSR